MRDRLPWFAPPADSKYDLSPERISGHELNPCPIFTKYGLGLSKTH